jgi:hypothetical protein
MSTLSATESAMEDVVRRLRVRIEGGDDEEEEAEQELELINSDEARYLKVMNPSIRSTIYNSPDNICVYVRSI